MADNAAHKEILSSKKTDIYPVYTGISVEDLTYLGTLVSKDNLAKDITAKINRACGAFSRLCSILKSKQYSQKIKIRLYNTNVKLVLLYSSECCSVHLTSADVSGSVLDQNAKRYYGRSMPFGNASLERPNIGLLTVEQALADFVTLLYHLKQDLNATMSPVIAFGGSYGGMLSAFIRFKYPNIIAGSIAASAPIFLDSPELNRDFFFSDVTKDFMNASSQCVTNVKSGFSALANMAASGLSGLQNVSKIFRLCKPLSSKDDYTHFLAWIRNSFTFLAMLDYPYPATFMGSLPANPVNVACDDIGNATDVVYGLAKATELFYNGTSGTLPCFDIFTEYVPCADPTGCGTGPAGIAWDYQACTQLTTVNGSNGQTDFFPVLPFTPEMRDAYCQKTWGVSPRRDWNAIEFWAENIEAASNIVFSNGDLDPWRDAGVLKTSNRNIKVAIVKDGAHHLDLRGHNDKDPIGVVAVREIEQQFIRKWINEYYSQL